MSRPSPNTHMPFITATAQGLSACHVCTAVGPAETHECDTCGARVSDRMKNSFQQSVAWLITSVVLYIPANFLPILSTVKLGQETTNTILGGVVTLWGHGSYPIAIVIFVASVLVPLAKIVVLAWLCLTVWRGSTQSLEEKALLFRFTEFIGRWSMIDVFVVGLLVALIRLGAIMSIYPGAAALAFAGMVASTMLAAIAFDPRLIWHSHNMQNNSTWEYAE